MGVNYVHCFRGTSLKEFHNGEEDNKRGQGRAFVPGENTYLSGFRAVFSCLLSFSMAQGEAGKTADESPWIRTLPS